MQRDDYTIARNSARCLHPETVGYLKIAEKTGRPSARKDRYHAFIDLLAPDIATGLISRPIGAISGGSLLVIQFLYWID